MSAYADDSPRAKDEVAAIKALRFLISLVGAALAFSGTASASTYYVSTSGQDSNPGTAATPFRTIQHAADVVSAGDTIIVRPGSYAGCRIGRSGTAGAACTLQAESQGTAVINSPSPANRHSSLIEIENFDAAVSYWVVDGFEVSGSPKYGVDLRNTDHVTVRNCKVHGSAVTGIFLAFSYHPLIQNNESYTNGEHGVYQSNSGDFPIIRGNNLHHNASAGLHMNGDRNFTPGDGIISFAVIEKNAIWENGRLGASGINCDGVSDSIISNNLLYNNHASGVSLYAIDGAEGSSRNRVYNNTIVMPSDGRWCVNIPAAAEGQSNPSGNKIENNVLYTPHAFRGSISIWGSSVPGFESDYNIVVNRFSDDGGGTNMPLSAWRSLGFDRHSVVSTPDQLFVNGSAFDYHEKEGGPAIDAGTILADVTDDLDGVPRPQSGKCDIGCYEFRGSGASLMADFSGSPLSGVAPLTVQFSDLSTGEPATWSWDFGDGSTSMLRNPSHLYQAGGGFAVSLTITNSTGQDSRTKTNFVNVRQPAARDFFCTVITVEAGRLKSGDLDGVRESDDVYLRIKSVQLDGKFGDLVTYFFETGLQSLSSLTVTSESRTAITPQRQQIMLFNFTAAEWEVVDDRVIVSDGDVTTTVAVPNPSRFVASSGQAKLRIRTGDETDEGKWKHSIDLVKITASP